MKHTLPEKIGDIIDFNKEIHLPVIQEWWHLYYGEITFPEDCVPETGAAVSYRGKLAGAAFIYLTNSSLIHIQYPVVDPGLGAGRRVNLLRTVISAAIDKCRTLLGGKGIIWACTDHSVVARIYSEHNMLCPGEADVFFMPLGGEPVKFLT